MASIKASQARFGNRAIEGGAFHHEDVRTLGRPPPQAVVETWKEPHQRRPAEQCAVPGSMQRGNSVHTAELSTSIDTLEKRVIHVLYAQ